MEYKCEKCGFNFGYEICRIYCFPIAGGISPGSHCHPTIHWCTGEFVCPECGHENETFCSD